LIEQPAGTLLSLLSKYESGTYRYLLKAFNENLIPTDNVYLDSLTGSISAYGMVSGDENAITLLYGQGQNGSDNYDIIVERIPPIGE